MAGCEFLQSCYLRGQLRRYSPGLAQACERSYCNGDYLGCARQVVARALGPEKVPVDMLPFESERAGVMVRNAKQQ